jgi:hypothetical protein
LTGVCAWAGSGISVNVPDKAAPRAKAQPANDLRSILMAIS